MRKLNLSSPAKVSEALLTSFLSRSAREGSALTHRERSVVQLIAEGYTNKQIAGLLKISVKTVETHRAASNAQPTERLTRGAGACCLHPLVT